MLKKITLLKDRVEDWTVYPFSVPTIASLTEIEVSSRVVFFAGENGTGKAPLQIVRYFLNNREEFLKELLAEPMGLFDSD